MSEEITASFHDLLTQAGGTADTYMNDGIKAMEVRLGVGAAWKYPQVLAALIQAASVDFVGNVIAQQVRAGLSNLADSLDSYTTVSEERTTGSDGRTIVEALDSVAYQLKMLGNADASTPMGAIEALGAVFKNDIAPAVQNVAYAIEALEVPK